MAKVNNINNPTLNLGDSISLKAKDGHHGKEVEISFNNGFISFNTSVPVSSILNVFLPVNKSETRVIESKPTPKATPVPRKR